MGNIQCRDGFTESGENFPVEESKVTTMKPLSEEKLLSDNTNSPRKSAAADFERLAQQTQARNLAKLREDLKKNPSAFILNNLVLSVQFFQNYEREREVMRSSRMKREIEVTRSLHDCRRRCIYEGSLEEHIGYSNRYRSPDLAVPEVMGHLRHILIHENLEIYPEEQYCSLMSKEYSSVGDPVYRLCMEDADHLPGFVMLRCVDLPPNTNTSSTTSGIVSAGSDDGSGRYSDYDPIREKDSSSDTEDSDANETDNQPVQHTKPVLSEGEKLLSELKQSIENRTNNVPTPSITKPPSVNSRIKERRDSGILLQPRYNVPMPPYLVRRDSGALARSIGDIVPLVNEGRRDSGIFPATQIPLKPLQPTQRNVVKKTTRARNDKRSKENVQDLSSSDDDYGYSRIEEMGRPLRYIKTNRPRDNSLPENSFRPLRVKVIGSDEADPYELEDIFETRTYLSSQIFAEHFTKIFSYLADKLNLGHTLATAQVVRSSVRCTETRQTPPPAYLAKYEFRPGVSVPVWPSCAFEWVVRTRKIVRDIRTNIKYVWPTPRQVDAIRNLGCHLVPEGGRVRGKATPHMDMQWQLDFGQAEAMLLSSLGHAHLQCLLWARLIYQHALAPLGLVSMYHVETVMFWLLEKNFADWPEEEIGERLQLVLHELYVSLRRGKLPHYFVKKRNLWLSKSKYDMRKVQERMFRIMENLVVVGMQAVRNLVTDPSGYELPDLSRLWYILTAEVSLAQLNPALLHISNSPPEDKSKDRDKKKKIKRNEDDSAGGFWQRSRADGRNKDPTREKLRHIRARIDAEAAAKQDELIQVNKDKVPDWSLPLMKLDLVRTKLLLDLFIKHFLGLARKGHAFRAYSQSFTWLMHADNLATLLFEHGFSDDAAKYKEEVLILRQAARGGAETWAMVPGLPGLVQNQTQKKESFRQHAVNGSNWELRKTPMPLPDVPNTSKTTTERRNMMHNPGNSDRGSANLRSDSPPTASNISPPANGMLIVTQAIIESDSSASSALTSSPSEGLPFNAMRRGTLFLSDNDELDDSTDL